MTVPFVKVKKEAQSKWERFEENKKKRRGFRRYSTSIDIYKQMPYNFFISLFFIFFKEINVFLNYNDFLPFLVRFEKNFLLL